MTGASNSSIQDATAPFYASAASVTSIFGRSGDIVAMTGDYNISQIGGAGTAAAENLTSVITDNGSGGLTIGMGQVTAAMLAGTGVTAGTYTNAIITVNAEGQITSAMNGTAGLGTVTSVSVVSTNGFSGTVATATTTPAISISTTITGLLKGNGTAISAANAGTDYQAPISLTTTGTSGAATFAGNVLNIPQYINTTYSAGTGLTLTGTTFSVNTSQNISTLSNLPTAGFVKTSSAGVLSVDTNTYLTTNQTITLTGDATGSGTTSIAVTLATVNANTGGPYNNVNLDAKGRVTSASFVNYQPAYSGFTATQVLFGDGSSTPASISGITIDATNVRQAINTFGVMGFTPTASLHIAAKADGTAGSAPFKISGGGTTLLTTPEDGAIERGPAGNLYWTYLANRYQLDRQFFQPKVVVADANYSFPTTGNINGTYEFPTPTANRTITFPAAFTQNGQQLVLWNKSTSTSFNWTIATTTSKDQANTTLTLLPNNVVWTFISDGSAWILSSTGGVGYVPISAATTLNGSYECVEIITGTFALTLPTAVGCQNRRYWIKNSGAGTTTLNTTSSQTIDGNASGVLTLAQYQGYTIQSNGVNWIILGSYGFSTGSVTSVSVASANGFSGTVATSTTTPVITLNTTITGLLKGNGTAISAANAGTDYQAPITLTTTGTSGAATFSGGTLNIPQYAGATYTAGTGLTLTGGAFSVNTSQNITTLSNFTSAGFVKTNASGLLSVDTNTYQTSGNYITNLTGDATASGPGSVALTLATVNSNVGSFGTAGSTGSFTVNAKGLITAASNTPIQITESQVTNLTSDLAGKQPNLPNFVNNEILFGNGTSTPVQDTTLYWDNTNKYLGVGRSSPTAVVHSQVNSTSQHGLAFLMTGTANDGSVDNANGAAIFLSHNGTNNRQIMLGDSLSGQGVRVLGSEIDGFNVFTGSSNTLVLGNSNFPFGTSGGDVTVASYLTVQQFVNCLQYYYGDANWKMLRDDGAIYGNQYDVIYSGAPSADATGKRRFRFVANASDGGDRLGIYMGFPRAASGIEDSATFTNTILQSGTAGYNGLKVNITESSTGSGAKNLLALQLNGTTKLFVDNAGNLTGSSLIKSGGTSSQFLKADGSVDTTSYQSSLTLTTTGTSGAATLSGGTLNIPQYSGGSGTTITNYVNNEQIDQSPNAGTTYGALSNSGLVYTVSAGAYASGKLAVYQNGQQLTQGSTADWVETSPSSGTFTLNNTLTGIIQAVYLPPATTATGLFSPIRVVTASGAITITGSDGTVVVNKTTGAASAISLSGLGVGQSIVVKDGKGDAATNNITITPASGLIDNNSTYVITTSKAAAWIQFDGTNYWII